MIPVATEAGRADVLLSLSQFPLMGMNYKKLDDKQQDPNIPAQLFISNNYTGPIGNFG